MTTKFNTAYFEKCSLTNGPIYYQPKCKVFSVFFLPWNSVKFFADNFEFLYFSEAYNMLKGQRVPSIEKFIWKSLLKFYIVHVEHRNARLLIRMRSSPTFYTFEVPKLKKKQTKRQLGRILITRDLTSVMSLISYKFNRKHHLYSGYGDVEIMWRCLCSGTYLRAEYNNNNNSIISYFNNTGRNGNDENTSTKTLNI